MPEDLKQQFEPCPCGRGFIKGGRCDTCGIDADAARRSKRPVILKARSCGMTGHRQNCACSTEQQLAPSRWTLTEHRANGNKVIESYDEDPIEATGLIERARVLAIIEARRPLAVRLGFTAALDDLLASIRGREHGLKERHAFVPDSYEADIGPIECGICARPESEHAPEDTSTSCGGRNNCLWETPCPEHATDPVLRRCEGLWWSASERFTCGNEAGHPGDCGPTTFPEGTLSVPHIGQAKPNADHDQPPHTEGRFAPCPRCDLSPYDEERVSGHRGCDECWQLQQHTGRSATRCRRHELPPHNHCASTGRECGWMPEAGCVRHHPPRQDGLPDRATVSENRKTTNDPGLSTNTDPNRVEVCDHTQMSTSVDNKTPIEHEGEQSPQLADGPGTNASGSNADVSADIATSDPQIRDVRISPHDESTRPENVYTSDAIIDTRKVELADSDEKDKL